MDDAPPAGRPQDRQCMYYCRILLAFISTVLVLVGLSMQVFSAGNLYGVPLDTMCTAYSGSPEHADKNSFTELIDDVLKQRQACLSLGPPSAYGDPESEVMKCCLAHSKPGSTQLSALLHGICADPWYTQFSTSNSSGLGLHETLDLFTDILGDFIGVPAPNQYGSANAEFWCKNCPNDVRANCPFDPPKNSTEGLCTCPGGKISSSREHFWSMSPESQLSGRYILCSDQAKVYRQWIEALFPLNIWTDMRAEHFDLAEKRFYDTCFSRKGQLGFILTVGPVLGVFSCIMTLFSLFKYCATTGLPGMTYNFVLLSISMTLVSFWPLSFTGAANLVARYSFCWGLNDPVVVFGAEGKGAPRLFTGQACYDMNSGGEHVSNPFVEQLGVYNAGYVTGGVLMIISEIIMLALVSKHSDVVLEVRLARPETSKPTEQL